MEVKSVMMQFEKGKVHKKGYDMIGFKWKYDVHMFVLKKPFMIYMNCLVCKCNAWIYDDI